MEDKKVIRDMVAVVGKGERKFRKIPLTDCEYDMIKDACERYGYKKPRDLLVDICTHDSIMDTVRESEKMHFSILLSPLATYINKIDSGVDVENARRLLKEEVKNLCRIYKS